MNPVPRLIHWTKERQVKAEAARDTLRRIVRDHESAELLVSASARGATLVDLVARADVGLEVKLVGPGAALQHLAGVKENLEHRYDRVIAVAANEQQKNVIRISPVEFINPLGGWSEDDVAAYARAHGTPVLEERVTTPAPLRLVERRLAAAGC
jgi:hypothetical protein